MKETPLPSCFCLEPVNLKPWKETEVGEMLNPTLHPDSQQLCIFQTFNPTDEPYLELELIFLFWLPS